MNPQSDTEQAFSKPTYKQQLAWLDAHGDNDIIRAIKENQLKSSSAARQSSITAINQSATLKNGKTMMVSYKPAKHRSWSYILIRLLPIWIISFVLIVLALQSCKSVNHPNSSVDDRIRNERAPVKQHKPNIK